MRDLQRRLAAAGFPPTGAEAAFFCASTEAALKRFQEQRGLRVTARCDEPTWRAIVEASWTLGDRLLMLVAPNFRGDDVVELQSNLGRIGFDTGRVDGIFGPDTARAVEDFQHNSGLNVDGVCGAATVRALEVMARQTGSGPGITALRELDTLTASARILSDHRVVVGQFGGLSPLSRQLVQALRHRSATVVASDEPDASIQAAMANRFDATVYVGFESHAGPRSTVHYYAVPQFVSAGGKSLAEQIGACCAARLPTLHPQVEGMRLPVLRETRMPAVLFTLGAIQQVLDHAPQIVDAVVEALEQWSSGTVLSPD